MPISPRQAQQTAGVRTKVQPLARMTHLKVGEGALPNFDTIDRWKLMFIISLLVHNASSAHRNTSAAHSDFTPATRDNPTADRLPTQYDNQTLVNSVSLLTTLNRPRQEVERIIIDMVPTKFISRDEAISEEEEKVTASDEDDRYDTRNMPWNTQFVLSGFRYRWQNPFSVESIDPSYETDPWRPLRNNLREVKGISAVHCYLITDTHCYSYVGDPSIQEYSRLKVNVAQMLREIATTATSKKERNNLWEDLAGTVLSSLPISKLMSTLEFINNVIKEIEGPFYQPNAFKLIAAPDVRPTHGFVVTKLPKNARVYETKLKRSYVVNPSYVVNLSGLLQSGWVLVGGIVAAIGAFYRKNLMSSADALFLKYRKKKVNACAAFLRDRLHFTRVEQDALRADLLTMHLPTIDSRYQKATLVIDKNYQCGEKLNADLRTLVGKKIRPKFNDKNFITGLDLEILSLTKQEIVDLVTQVKEGLVLKSSVAKDKKIREAQKAAQEAKEKEEAEEKKRKDAKDEEEKKNKLEADKVEKAAKAAREALIAQEKAEQKEIIAKVDDIFKYIDPKKRRNWNVSKFEDEAQKIQNQGGKIGTELKKELEVRHSKYIRHHDAHEAITKLKLFYAPPRAFSQPTATPSRSGLRLADFPGGFVSSLQTAASPASVVVTTVAPVVARALTPVADPSVATHPQTLFAPLVAPAVQLLKPVKPWDAIAKTVLEEALDLHKLWGDYWLIHPTATASEQFVNKSKLVCALARILRRMPWERNERNIVNALIHKATHYVFREHDKGNHLMDFLFTFVVKLYEGTEVSSDDELKSRVKSLLAEDFIIRIAILDKATIATKEYLEVGGDDPRDFLFIFCRQFYERMGVSNDDELKTRVQSLLSDEFIARIMTLDDAVITTKQYLEMIFTCLKGLRELAVSECRVQENFVGMVVLIGEIWNVIRGNRDFDDALFELKGCRDSTDFKVALQALSVTGRDPYLHQPTPIFKFEERALNELLQCADAMLVAQPSPRRASQSGSL